MNVKQKILEKYAINAYAVRNEVSQRCTEKAIQNPNATKREAAMMEDLIFEQLNYVRIKDVVAVLDEATNQLQEIFDDTDKRAGDVRVISVVRDLKERVLAVLDGEK